MGTRESSLIAIDIEVEVDVHTRAAEAGGDAAAGDPRYTRARRACCLLFVCCLFVVCLLFVVVVVVVVVIDLIDLID